MKQKIVIIMVIASLLSISGCFQQKHEVDEEIKNLMETVPDVPKNSSSPSVLRQKASDLRVILPIEGELAFLSIPFIAGMETALAELNKKGGLDGEQINLVTENLQCDNEKYLKEIGKKVSVDQSQIVISGACSDFITKFATYTNNEKIVNLIAFPNNISDNEFDYVFNLLPSYRTFMKQAIEHILKEQNIKSLSLVYDDSFTESDIGIFEHYFTEGNGILVDKELIKSDGEDITFSEGFSTHEYDGILALVEKPTTAKALIKALEKKSITKPIIINNDTLSLTYDTTLNITTYKPRVKANSTIEIPTEHLAYSNYYLNGYDAAMLTIKTLSKVGNNSDSIRGYLLGMNYSGESYATISFNDNGEILNADYVFTPFQTTEDSEIISIEIEDEGSTATSLESNEETDTEINPPDEVITESTYTEETGIEESSETPIVEETLEITEEDAMVITSAE